MAIKGLTDRGLSFPEIGQIRKGAPKEPNKPGKDLTYFRVEFAEQEQKAAALFKEVYGDEPRAIRIILPFNEIERMWDAWLEAYTAGRMVARSDGEFITYQVDTKNGEIIVKGGINIKTGQPKPHPANDIAGLDYKGNPVKFKPTGRLKVIIPELARAAYLTVMTTSVHDIANISAQLRAFSELNGGQIAGIPFYLRRRPNKISVPKEDGQRVRMVKWMLSIEADPEWVKAKLSEVKRLALPENGMPELTEYLEEEIIDATFSDDELEEVEEEEGEEGEGEIVEQEINDERPYPPEILKEKIEEWSMLYAGQFASDERRKMLAKTLNTCFDGDETKRYEACGFLTGKASTKDIPDAFVLAMLKTWFEITNWDQPPSEVSIQEARSLTSVALVAEGQQEMNLEAVPE